MAEVEHVVGDAIANEVLLYSRSKGSIREREDEKDER